MMRRRDFIGVALAAGLIFFTGLDARTAGATGPGVPIPSAAAMPLPPTSDLPLVPGDPPLWPSMVRKVIEVRSWDTGVRPTVDEQRRTKLELMTAWVARDMLAIERALADIERYDRASSSQHSPPIGPVDNGGDVRGVPVPDAARGPLVNCVRGPCPGSTPLPKVPS
jgi:hypothetical protein